jgi:predicted DCC family thiol-disulfide oxidoreductase YuxK
MKIKIIYDQECPFCSDFVQILRIKSAGNEVELINARETSTDIISELSAKYNLDEGMVVKIDDAEYYGDQAALILAVLSTTNTYRGKLYQLILRNKRLASFSYPVLVALRKLYFKLIGKKFIYEDN